ncbi:L10-interacting MYB domain-containing protein [Actinidia chinensis var. chinensis]|uniref:L10-interacting MYB domain-containing protein n=1 Tax=Actinidia chinensis var. chinensis TaxID=1590841 RepID=A0A2R6PP29_ACTCC|nr:L10-interacting MYB domain-containing protein [Actinidia chinensis var. chinensis]
MGIRERSGSDRLRTIWTPEMVRYFIDLMLEEVGRGNRIDDHLFSKRAWKHMMSLFNAKFKFQYEKDVLKNRHKTLRNLYKAIKFLLDQKGFSWDETRQMVTAENEVWDDYIKVHPEARSYRIKTIPYYNDLCVIYRSAAVGGKASLSSPDATDGNIPGSETGRLLEGSESPATTIDNGKPGDNLLELSSHSGNNSKTEITPPSGVGEGAVDALSMIDEDYGISMSNTIDNVTLQPIADSSSRVGTRSRTFWQPPMDRYFIDLMLEHVQKGNQIDGLFPKQAWMEMIASFNARFGFKYDIDILKNRYKTLRRQYKVIKNLLDLNGFSWDETRQMVTADDCVWQDYIKAHTNARQYMTRPMPYYKDLCMICRVLSADGRDRVSGHNLDQQDEVQEAKFGRSLAASFSCEDQVGDVQESSRDFKISVSDQKNKHHIENSPHSEHSKKARGNDEGMASALREMATAVSSLADKKKDDEDSNSISVEIVIEAIQSLPDMDEDLVLDACDLLEDEKKAKTFLALDVKLRKKWLIRKLRPQQ